MTNLRELIMLQTTDHLPKLVSAYHVSIFIFRNDFMIDMINHVITNDWVRFTFLTVNHDMARKDNNDVKKRVYVEKRISAGYLLRLVFLHFTQKGQNSALEEYNAKFPALCIRLLTLALLSLNMTGCYSIIQTRKLLRNKGFCALFFA